MRTFVLPQLRAAEPNDAVIFRDSLWRDEKIQIAASTLLDRLLLRISAQAYVDASDIERFVDVLERRGWPGRK
jgi:selenocysteine lyase/cysteine desulfurase